MPKTCEVCTKPIPEGLRKDAKYCSPSCRWKKPNEKYFIVKKDTLNDLKEIIRIGKSVKK
jgi:hypothetical protein